MGIWLSDYTVQSFPMEEELRKKLLGCWFQTDKARASPFSWLQVWMWPPPHPGYSLRSAVNKGFFYPFWESPLKIPPSPMWREIRCKVLMLLRWQKTITFYSFLTVRPAIPIPTIPMSWSLTLIMVSIVSIQFCFGKKNKVSIKTNCVTHVLTQSFRFPWWVCKLIHVSFCSYVNHLMGNIDITVKQKCSDGENASPLPLWYHCPV